MKWIRKKAYMVLDSCQRMPMRIRDRRATLFDYYVVRGLVLYTASNMFQVMHAIAPFPIDDPTMLYDVAGMCVSFYFWFITVPGIVLVLLGNAMTKERRESSLGASI